MGERRAGGELTGQLGRAGVGVGDQLVAEADGEGLLGPHLAPGEEELEGASLADEAR